MATASGSTTQKWGALDVATGRRVQRHTGIAFHFVHDPALLGNIAGIVFVHDIPSVEKKDATI